MTPKAPITEHPVFGPIAFTTRRGWERKDFEFWDFRGLHLMIDAGADGPTSEQEVAFQRLRERRVELLPKCLDAVALAASHIREQIFRKSGYFNVRDASGRNYAERNRQLNYRWRLRCTEDIDPAKR